jgi:hypothetical protein
VTAKWDADIDLDLQMDATKEGKIVKHLDYNSGNSGEGYEDSVTDEEGDEETRYTLDVDDTGTGDGFYNPGGLETITVPRITDRGYRFSVHRYDASIAGEEDLGNWKDFNINLRVYYDNCTTYKAEAYDDWPGFLNSSALEWLAAFRVGAKNADNPYARDCYENALNGPCAALCTSVVTTNDDGESVPQCVATKRDCVAPTSEHSGRCCLTSSVVGGKCPE